MATKSEEVQANDNEDIFLNSLMKGHTFWKKKVRDLEKDQRDTSKERQYAEAFRLLINQFTELEDKKE